MTESENELIPLRKVPLEEYLAICISFFHEIGIETRF